jgi:hypothetical protein
MATPTNLPAAFVAGAILTADQQNNLRGAFRVLQVVNASTVTPVTNNTNGYIDTGLTATITPQSATSKILVLLSQNGNYKAVGDAGSALTLKLMRGATDISFPAIEMGFNGINGETILGSISTCVLDNPATTSAVTYKTMFANRVNAASVRVQLLAAMSTMVLMEISA